MVWTNAPAKVYHGTTDTYAANISSVGAQTTFSRGPGDFGLGFYVTSDLNQAQDWANTKVRTVTGLNSAAVVEFDLDRNLVGAHADHLSFVLADAAFKDFVLFNRHGSLTHGRAAHLGPYDVVYGPVAAYPKNLTYASCDQICFVQGGKSSAIKALAFASIRTPTSGQYFP